MISCEYRRVDNIVLLDTEYFLVNALRNGPPQWREYSQETKDWLLCQKLLNRLVAKAVNGETTFSRMRASDWIYRFLFPEPTLWRGPMWDGPPGPYTGRLWKDMGDNTVTLRDLYRMMNEASNVLYKSPPEIRTQVQRYVIKNREVQVPPHGVVDKMRDILSPLDGQISAYVHGSMGNGEFTAFSDVDDLIIVHHESWENLRLFREVIQRLEYVTRLFQQIDPLQHHGHWIYTDFDLLCLDDTIMPLVVLGEAVKIAGLNEVNARTQTHRWGFACILWDIIQDLRKNLLVMCRGHISLYALKNIIGSISLLPALAFQVRGEIIDKKGALLRSEEIFSDEALQAVRWASELRETWDQVGGYGWIATMRTLCKVLPFRREALEKMSRHFSPVVNWDSIPFFTEDVIAAAFRFSNECAKVLECCVLPEPKG